MSSESRENKYDDQDGIEKKYDKISIANTNSNRLNNIMTGNSRTNLNFRDDKDQNKTPETFHCPINRNYWYRGELMELVNNPMEELDLCTEVFIEQKIELLEVLTGYETPNRYHVYIVDKTGQKKYLFKCKEESTWFCRNCCASGTREFQMKVIHVKDATKTVDYKKTIINISRPFTCTMCCFKRPTMTAQFNSPTEEGRSTLGSVVENFSCDPSLSIYVENNNLKWNVKSKCCQCGFFCRCFSLGKCYDVDFLIYDAFDKLKMTSPVGTIHKVFKGISELITDADAFLLTFPKNTTANEKMMLVAAVLMIDYRYYEESSLCNLSSIL